MQKISHIDVPQWGESTLKVRLSCDWLIDWLCLFQNPPAFKMWGLTFFLFFSNKQVTPSGSKPTLWRHHLRLQYALMGIFSFFFFFFFFFLFFFLSSVCSAIWSLSLNIYRQHRFCFKCIVCILVGCEKCSKIKHQTLLRTATVSKFLMMYKSANLSMGDPGLHITKMSPLKSSHCH